MERMITAGARTAEAYSSTPWVRHAGCENWIISDAMRESVSHLLQTAIY